MSETFVTGPEDFDDAEPSPDFECLVEAAMALYMAGHWSCDVMEFGGPNELQKQAKLWEDLRDALGILPGVSTAAEANDPHFGFPVDEPIPVLCVPDGVQSVFVASEDYFEVPVPVTPEDEIQIIPSIVRGAAPSSENTQEATPLEIMNFHLSNITDLLQEIAENTEVL